MKNMKKLMSEVIEMLLVSEEDSFSELRRQTEHVEIANIELTGVGFFATLKVGSDEHRLNNRTRFTIGNVAADIEGLKHGAGFLLFIEDGYLQMLEGFTYEEPWPDELNSYQLRHIQE